MISPFALAIARRELGSLFGGPLGWMLAAVFELLAGWLFYSDLTFVALFRDRPLWPFVLLDWRLVVLLVVPLLTMRLLATERRQGTLELLWTSPLRDGEVLAGKFLAAVAAFLLMLAGTALGPLALWLLHPFPLGPLVAGYLGLLLLGTACIACGLAASACTASQAVSALLTYGTLALLWVVTWNEAALGETWAPILLQLSLFDHFYGFSQGLIDSRDVAWFIAVAVFFLFVAHRALGARAWRA